MAFNYHHAAWEKRQYTTPFERRFREHSGLVVPADIENHEILHRNLMAPTKPDLHMMDAILETLGPDEFSQRAEVDRGYLKRPRIEALPEDRFTGLYQVIELMLSESEDETSAYRALREREFAKHLCRQIILLEEGSRL